MSIKLADIVEFLNSSRGIVQKISKETGIDQFKLYRYKDNKGEPAGDEMITLLDYVRAAKGEFTEMQNSPEEVNKKYVTMLETQIKNLTRSNEILLEMISSNSAVGGSSHSPSGQTGNSIETMRRALVALSPEELEMIAKQLAGQMSKTDEFQKSVVQGKEAQ